MKKRGFTLIELLVVIAIISLLSSIVLASLSGAREKAKIALAKQQLTQIRNAIELMDEDTGLGPNGCPLNVDSDIEIDLDSPLTGLITKPEDGDTICDSSIPAGNLCHDARDPQHDPLNGDSPCMWTATEIAKWKGPYIKLTKDPWGHPYQFDPDYFYKTGECSPQSLPFGLAVYSEGPNTAPPPQAGQKDDYPGCPTTPPGPSDDIYLILKDFPPRGITP